MQIPTKAEHPFRPTWRPESTNTEAIVRLLAPPAGRVAIANPLCTRAIAEAKIKTDEVDAAVLAQLLAAGLLPEVWMPDEETAALRRQEFHKVRRPNRMQRTALRAAADAGR